jgi:hypothetical protein
LSWLSSFVYKYLIPKNMRMSNCYNLKLGISFFCCLVCSIWTLSAQERNTGLQFIHACKGTSMDSIDIYLGNTILVEDLPFSQASAFVSISSVNNQKFTVLPHRSTALKDSIFSFSLSPKKDSLYTITLLGNAKSGTVFPYGRSIGLARKTALNAQRTEVSFVHAAPGAQAIDVVLRVGPMILGNLGYGKASNYLEFEADENFLDVKVSGTSDIIGTYRMNLQAYKGKALKVVIVGETSRPDLFQFFGALEDGSQVALNVAPIARVQYVNLLPQTVDVFKNGTRFSNDAAFCGAMPFKYMPADVNMNIAVSSATSINAQNPYAQFKFTFENMKTYLAISGGELNNPAYPLSMFFYDQAREKSPDGKKVNLTLFQGNYEWPGLSITNSNNNQNLFSALRYGGFAESLVDAQRLNLVLRRSDNNTELGRFNLDLGAYAGQSLFIFTARNPLGKAAGLWAVRPNGEVAAVSSPTVAVNDFLENSSLVVFPNPSTEWVQINAQLKKSTRVSAYVTDVRGKILLTQTQVNAAAGAYSSTFDVQALPAGVYVLGLQFEGGVHSSSLFIVQ